MHHGKKESTWLPRSEVLYDSAGKHRWIEHRTGSKVDVVALPLTAFDDDIKLCPIDMVLSDTNILPTVAMTVSIIGFPFGLAKSHVQLVGPGATHLS